MWQFGCSPTSERADGAVEDACTALFPARFASSASSAMRMHQEVSSRRSRCLHVVARRRAMVPC